MNLADSEPVRRARRFRDLERRLFEVMGRWVPEVADPELKLALRTQSFRHAWHADLWANLIPPGGEGGDPAAGGRLEEAVEAMAQAPDDNAARLDAVYRVVLPELVTTYAGYREAASLAADGALVRALTLILADDVDALETVHRLLPERHQIQ